MSWAIEYNEDRQPVRMHWMGPQPKPPREIKPDTNCKACGCPDGWHKIGCSNRAAPYSEVAPHE